MELPAGSAVVQPHVLDFTPKQQQVFDLIAEGKNTPEIAAVMGISEKGVKWHQRLILKKTNCKNKKELRAKLGLLIDANKMHTGL
jgi:DNA-binding CsgD family transcriptional regulator